jgi:ribosome recycling factor
MRVISVSRVQLQTVNVTPAGRPASARLAKRIRVAHPFTLTSNVEIQRNHGVSRVALHAKKGDVQDDAAQVASVREETEEKMEKSLDSVKRNFGTVRTGRANPSMLDRIVVEYYGAPTPLAQIANVTTPEATMLVIQPYDISAIPDIERAIMGSDLDITPNNDGKVIRLQVPPLTAERRKEMTKVTSKMGEEGKVAVRNVRRDALKKVEKLEKDGVIGEDGKKDLESEVQKMTDDYVKQIDALIKAKSDELTKV